ncbi:transposase [bacterium]
MNRKEYQIGRSRYQYYSDYAGPYYLTCTTIQWMALFGIPDITKNLIDSLSFMIEHDRIELHGFVVMEHHLHLVASGRLLSKETGIFKSYTARMIIDYLEQHHYTTILKQMRFFKKQHKKEQEYQVWEEGSHPQLLIDRKILNQKLNYIHYNPVRSGYIDDPLNWRYSSYRHYMGKECILPITMLD